MNIVYKEFLKIESYYLAIDNFTPDLFLISAEKALRVNNELGDNVVFDYFRARQLRDAKPSSKKFDLGYKKAMKKLFSYIVENIQKDLDRFELPNM